MAIDRAAELQRFNELTPNEADNMLTNAEGDTYEFRSCWYCNSAHEHLKSHELVYCFGCQVRYLRGYPLCFVFQRKRGEPITDEQMQPFIDALNRD